MKFVHIADLHMGQSFKSASFGSRFGAIKRHAIKENLKQVIEFCNKENVDFLLMAGDCIEADYIQVNDLFDLKYMFEKLNRTRVIMIAGNHDPAIIVRPRFQSMEWPSHVFIIEQSYQYLEFEQENIGFFCASWQNKSDMPFEYDLLNQMLEKTKMDRTIGILHGDIYSDQGYMPLDRQRLMDSKLDYIALGHIHKPEIISDKMAYPGSLEPLDFGETGKHGFVYGILDDSGPHLRHIEQMIHPMKQCQLDVTQLNSGMEIIEEIKKHLEQFDQKDMIRLYLMGEMRISFDALETLVQEDWNSMARSLVSYLEVIDRTRQIIDIEQVYAEHREDIIGYYIKALEEKSLNDKAYEEALVLGVKMLLNEVD